MSLTKVYLDLNQIIELAKARKNSDETKIKELMHIYNEGKAIFPISFAHLMEICSIMNEVQRQNLADVIRDVSKSQIIRSLFDVMYAEVFNRVAEHYEFEDKKRNIKDVVFDKGYLKAIGLQKFDFKPWKEIDIAKSLIGEAEISKIINDDSFIKKLVLTYIPKIKDGSDEHKKIMSAIESDRIKNKGKSIDKMAEECVLGLSEKFVFLVLQAGKELGMSLEEMYKKPPVHFWNKEFMASLPTIDIWSKMHVYLYSNPEIKVEVNHLYDISHLAVSIAYMDIIVTDKEMVHVIKSGGLDVRYNTSVTAKLDEALKLLEGEENVTKK